MGEVLARGQSAPPPGWLEATLASIDEAVITADRDGRVGFLNPAAESFLGIVAGAALGHHVGELFDFVDCTTQRPLDSPLEQAFEQRAPVAARQDSAIRLPDGQLRPVEASATPIEDRDGRLMGGVMVLRDASETRVRELALRQAYAEFDRQAAERGAALARATAALKESTALLQNFAVSAPEFIFAKDRDGRLLMANPAALRALGLEQEQTAGGGGVALFGSPEEIRRIREADLRILDTGEPETLVRTRLTAAGPRTYQITKSPLRDDRGQVIGIVGAATDVTEQGRAQRELEHLLVAENRLRSEAERASRAKDEFLAIVSHELRSPLNALRGWSHILSSTPHPDPALVNRAAQAIKRNVEHQTRLIDDLLDTSRIISGKLEIERRPVNLVEVVNAALDVSRPSALAKHVELAFAAAQPVLAAYGDSGRLQQVVINLLSNAVKFTPADGRVEVRLGRRGERIVLTVADTGIGIEPDFLPHVFDRFSQADSSTVRRYSGLGIGLALVRYLVELHGGTVRADSPGTGLGATFTVELPVARPCPAALSGEDEPSAPGQPLHGVRVLLLDDDPDARDFMRYVLAEAGAEVQAFASGGELLSLLEKSGGWDAPTVLVLDIAMPDDDGFSVLARVRALERLPFIPALAVTALAHLDRRRFVQAGFQNCLGKPVDIERLVATLAELAGGGQGAARLAS